MKTRLIEHSGRGGRIRIAADSPNPAAEAAAILARRMYGKRGTVATLREDHHSIDGSTTTYEAFIGKAPTPREVKKYGNGVTGRNVWIYV